MKRAARDEFTVDRNPRFMNRPSLLLALASVVAWSAMFVGCEAFGDATIEREVVIEGRVVPDDTFRVDREPAGDDAPPLETATITVKNKDGEKLTVSCDREGRFRVGPIRLSGHEDDQLVVTSPGYRTLHLSCLFPHEGRETAPDETVVVTREIALPKAGPAATS